MGKQKDLIPVFDINKKEPLIHDPVSGNFINSFKNNDVPVRQPNAVPPKTNTIKKFANGSKPNIRPERLDERITRLHYELDGGPKPDHYDNPNIIDTENYKQPPKKFDNNDPSTYPSDRSQKQKMNSWDLIMETSKGNPAEMKEIRNILRKTYKSMGPDYLSDRELKMIGMYKPKKKPIIDVPKLEPKVEVKPEPKVTIPQKPLEQIIKERADRRLALEQEQYAKNFGVGGITDLFKPI